MNLVSDQISLLRELHLLRGGITDTSTLIYLERLGLLPQTARCFSLLLIAQVVTEYGGNRKVLFLWPHPASEQRMKPSAGRLTLGQPVLSEDKQVLRRARALNLSCYNTLMIVLALCAQKHLPLAVFPELRQRIAAFSRYSPAVMAVGDAVYQALRRSRTGDD
jgi:hypothetical protein